jgi:hypothetical protein
MHIDKIDWRKASELNSPAPERSVSDMRQELKYLRRKRRFIKSGAYLPMTTHNYQRAANRSYCGVIGINEDRSRMKLACGHWHAVPAANPLPAKFMEAHRFCSDCADRIYRNIMLDEIDESIKTLTEAIRATKPWWIRILTAIVVCTLASGLALQGWASWHGTPHVVGAFDPRSDENADGSCP